MFSSRCPRLHGFEPEDVLAQLPCATLESQKIIDCIRTGAQIRRYREGLDSDEYMVVCPFRVRGYVGIRVPLGVWVRFHPCPCA